MWKNVVKEVMVSIARYYEKSAATFLSARFHLIHDDICFLAVCGTREYPARFLAKY